MLSKDTGVAIAGKSLLEFGDHTAGMLLSVASTAAGVFVHLDARLHRSLGLRP